MSQQPGAKSSFGCITFLLIAMVVVSYRTTKSLNPLAVYSSGGIISKILVSLIAILIGASLVQMAFAALLRTMVRIGGNARQADDVYCPGCGLPLIKFMSAYGPPVLCVQCKRVWHNGPSCFNKDLPPGVGMIHLCPICLRGGTDEQLISFEDDR